MKKLTLMLLVVSFATTFLGCKRDMGTVQGHTLGESFAQFIAKESPQTGTPAGVAYTGTIHCFETPELGDKCKGTRQGFDNAHFTFVDNKLVNVETVGAGGLIGDKNQNWNWNLYLSDLTKQYGKPDKMTATDAVWTKHNYVVHAYLTFETLPFTNTAAQTERIDVVNREFYNQSNK